MTPPRASRQRPVEGEPLRGWRLWHVIGGDDGPLLTSWWTHTAWPARRAVESRCAVHGPRPALHHACGIHAFAGYDQALAYAEHGPREGLLFSRRVDRVLAVAIGRVSGWGRSVRHAAGWRAQYAYPFDLYLLSGDRGVARRVADRYAVETLPFPPAVR